LQLLKIHIDVIMKKNVGRADQFIRILLGLVLIVLSFFVPTVWDIIMLILGILMILTGTISYCPVYLLFKINTRGKKEKQE
jgi:membrane-bound ClpP family serine protease